MSVGACVVRGCRRPTQYTVDEQSWCYQDAPQSLRDYWWALQLAYQGRPFVRITTEEMESVVESAYELGPFGIVSEEAR